MKPAACYVGHHDDRLEYSGTYRSSTYVLYVVCRDCGRRSPGIDITPRVKFRRVTWMRGRTYQTIVLRQGGRRG